MTVEIGFRARLDALAAELRTIPGMTEENVRRAVKGAELEWKRMPRAAKQAAQASAKHMQEVTRSITSISPAAGAATAAIEQMSAVLGPGMAATLGPIGLVAAAVAAIGGASYVASSRMSALVDEVALLAEGTGLSQRQVVALQHAVSAAGGDFNKTREALATFNRVMQDDLAGKTGPEVNRVLNETIARIEAIPDPAGRAAERMRVFGTESARALAGLTSSGMAEAERNTRTLADAIEDAAGSSAAMDEASADLSRAVSELTVVLGDELAPAVVRVTGLLTGLVDAGTAVADSAAGQVAGWVLAGGVLGELATALERFDAVMHGGQRMRAEFAAITSQQTDRLRAQREEMEQAAAERDAWLSGWTAAPALVAGRAADPDAPRRAQAAADRARAEAQAVAEATQAVRDQFRRDDFDAEVAAAADRQALYEQGAARMAELHAEEMAAAEAEREHARRMLEARDELSQRTLSAFGMIAQAATDNAALIAGLQAVEAANNVRVAVTRALAEGGPFLGFQLAGAIIGATAPLLASIASAARGGGGAVQIGGGRGRENARGYGFTGRDTSGNIVTIAEYRGELFDAQSRDAVQRTGSPLRDIARNRRVSR